MESPMPAPIRIIAELPPDVVVPVLHEVLHALTRPTQTSASSPASQPAPDTAADDDASSIESTADPPLLPAHLAQHYYLSKTLCRNMHHYLGLQYCLRKKTNRHCATYQGHQPSATNGRTAIPQQERPTLPKHLRETTFLSPITCAEPSHRYRETAYTLRFLDSELCCMCIAQRQPHLVGDVR